VGCISDITGTTFEGGFAQTSITPNEVCILLLPSSVKVTTMIQNDTIPLLKIHDKPIIYFLH
jgi:hypothetical protein